MGAVTQLAAGTEDRQDIHPQLTVALARVKGQRTAGQRLPPVARQQRVLQGSGVWTLCPEAQQGNGNSNYPSSIAGAASRDGCCSPVAARAEDHGCNVFSLAPARAQKRRVTHAWQQRVLLLLGPGYVTGY